MQAYFETEAYLPVNHSLNIRLPDEIPAGKVRIAVIYEKPSQNDNNENMADFLDSLPLNAQGRSSTDIEKQINEERNSWDDN